MEYYNSNFDLSKIAKLTKYDFSVKYTEDVTEGMIDAFDDNLVSVVAGAIGIAS